MASEHSSQKPPVTTPANSTKIVNEEKLSLFRKLVYRRIPQSIGIYLAVSWTFFEFFESLISQYNMSPHWQDISLLIIILLFPSILILAYRHGAPGAQQWSNLEKVGIPTNILITLLIVYSQFASKDLGTSGEMVIGYGPDGKMIELHRPKAEFRKRLSIAFFDINDSSIEEYLALGIPLALKTDLEQDPFLNVLVPTDFADELKQSNYRDLKVPLSLMFDIAKNNRIEFLLTGNVVTKKQSIIVNYSLFRVNDGTLIKQQHTIDHDNIFVALDEVSIQIKSAMGLSGGHINNTVDLPITEQLTSSMDAYIAFAKSHHDSAFKEDFKASEEELIKAISLDETFAIASSEYASLLFAQNRTHKGLELLKIAKQHNYRLSPSRKFAISTIEALFNAKPEIASNTVDQWINLFPDDADAWQMKYVLLRNFDKRLEAIEALRKIIAIEPYGTQRHLTIGKIYASLGDIESALDEYEIFTAGNPANAQGHILIGDTYRTLGKLDAARMEYQQAKVLFTNDPTADRRLADLMFRTGDYEQSEKYITEFLSESRTSEDEFLAWSELAELFWLKGQYTEALNAQRNSFDALKKFSPETIFLLRRAQQAWRFAAAGLPEEGQLMIDDAKILLESNDDNLYKVNIDIADAMFKTEQNQTEDSLMLIEHISSSLGSYIGTGIDDNISMFRGIAHYKNKDYINAAMSMAIFLKQNPNDQTSMMTIMGESLLKSGDVSGAKETFERILIEYPAHPLANLGMAQVEVSQENIDDAKVYLNRALQAWEFAEESFEPAIEARKIYKELESI